MRIDTLTHILPPHFVERRDEVVRRDATFAELFGSRPNARIGSAEELLRSMDDAEVDLSVVAGFGWTDVDTARVSNDYLLESAAMHTGRLMAVCSVNPLWGEAAVAEAERCLAAGARGIGELHADTQGWRDFSGDELDALMELLRPVGALTIVHGSEPLGHAYPGKGTMTPDRLHALAARYPANRVVASHFGGGLPWYANMPEIGGDLPNVWYDTAATPYLYQPNVYSSAAAAVGAERIVFASDWPLLSQKRALRHLRADPMLYEDARSLVEGANAATLLGL